MPTHDAAPEGATNDAVRLLCRGALTILSPGAAALGGRDIRCLTAALVLFDELSLALEPGGPPADGTIPVSGRQIAFRIVRLGPPACAVSEKPTSPMRRAIYLRLAHER